MAVTVEQPPDSVSIRRLSVEEYHRLIEFGFFAPDERVELLEGVLHRMTPKGPRHAGVLSRLLRLCFAMIGDRAEIRAQDSITIPSRDSEPESDLTLAEPRGDNYVERHPLPDEVLLVVEIADTSVATDRGPKLRTYAAAGIEEYWCINLEDDQIEVHREPAVLEDGTATYRQRSLYTKNDTVAPAHFPDCRVDVAALLS